VVSAAAALRIEGDRIAQARVALGGVAMKPWRAGEAEAILSGASSAGAKADAVLFQRAADAALAQAKPSGDNGFKIELARRIIVRALTLAAAGTPERMPALPASPFASPLASVSGAVTHA
jgi:xanthine dehydrogenase YagS FAD-binding subunit